jgi:chromosome segregation ATPase
MDDLQDILDNSWHDEEEALEQHLEAARTSTSRAGGGGGGDLSSLALNLSSQAEYNNELLQYIQHLEGQYSAAQSSLSEQEVHRGELERHAAASHERAEELQRQLHTTTSLYEELSARSSQHSSEGAAAAAQCEALEVQVRELSQQKQQLTASKEAGAARLVMLEGELSDLKRRRLVSDDDCTDSLATLSISLEKSTEELARERSAHYALQLEMSVLRDENIQMTRRLEHFVRAGQEGEDARESGARRLREAETTVTALQHQVGPCINISLSLSLSLSLSFSNTSLCDSRRAPWRPSVTSCRRR